MVGGGKCCGKTEKENVGRNKRSHECQVHVGVGRRVAVLKKGAPFALLGRWHLGKDLKEVGQLEEELPSRRRS